MPFQKVYFCTLFTPKWCILVPKWYKLVPFEKGPPQWQLLLFWECEVTRGVYPDDLKWCLLHACGIRKVDHISNQSDWATLQLWDWPYHDYFHHYCLLLSGVFCERTAPNPVQIHLNQGNDWQTEWWKLFWDSGRIFLHWPFHLSDLKKQIIL